MSTIGGGTNAIERDDATFRQQLAQMVISSAIAETKLDDWSFKAGNPLGNDVEHLALRMEAADEAVQATHGSQDSRSSGRALLSRDLPLWERDLAASLVRFFNVSVGRTPTDLRSASPGISGRGCASSTCSKAEVMVLLATVWALKLLTSSSRQFATSTEGKRNRKKRQVDLWVPTRQSANQQVDLLWARSA